MGDEEQFFFMFNRKDSIFLLVLGIILVIFSLTSMYSYLLFHTFSELFSIVIAAAIFIIAWNSRDYIDNKYLLFIGIAYLFIGEIDLLHTLAYKGMNIFAGFDANLPGQLWIAGRYLEAATLIAAALLISRSVNVYKELAVYTAIFSALLIVIFTGIFPDCYIDGQGLTTFKITSEYIICLMLVLAGYLLYRRKEYFEPGIFNLVIISIFFTILSELAFTFYVSVYDFSNLIGHLFKIISFALIYYALVESGIRRPHEVIFRELSEKKKEATKEKDKLEMYLEVAGVMFLVLDVKGIVRLINLKGCEILGYKESEIVGMDFIDNFIPAKKRDEAHRAFSITMTGDIESYRSLEYDVLTKNGDIRTLLWQNSITRDEEGIITGTLSSGVDITLRKQAESLLQRTQFAFDHSPDEIYYVNSEGQLIYANLRARESFAIESDSAINKTIFDINPEITQSRWKEIWSEMLKEGFHGFETVHRHSDGTSYPVEIVAYLITYEGVKYSCNIARDITERKKAEDALQEVNKKLNLLSSITRHDILNQITVAAGYMEILRLDKGISEDTKAEKYIEKVLRAIETIRKQIIFTGYYRDLGEQAPQWFDMGSIVTATQESFRFDEFNLRNDIKNTEIFADPLFGKVIFNLIDNAIKHGETISEISFFTDETPDELIIVCEDDGMGIPDEAKEQIFMREYFKNSGFGLFLSREILAITCLTITETGTFGEGARFEIHVPKGRYREISSPDDERKSG